MSVPLVRTPVSISIIGNRPFAILAECKRAAQLAGYTPSQVREFVQAGYAARGYINLMNVCVDWFRVE